MGFQAGDIISYFDMCQEEGTSLQKGMNFHLRNGSSVILMSIRPGSPYEDRVEEDGRVLIYEGHDVHKRKDGADPKKVDQPMHTENGSLTENGRFFNAAKNAARGKKPEIVRVYEKIKSGIWVFNGVFELKDAWQEKTGRSVFKFRLEMIEQETHSGHRENVDNDIPHNRVIPTAIKLEVWKRDRGQCSICKSKDNLHFDHILPFSKGGSSLVGSNIQLLCARHNLQKRDKII